MWRRLYDCTSPVQTFYYAQTSAQGSVTLKRSTSLVMRPDWPQCRCCSWAFAYVLLLAVVKVSERSSSDSKSWPLVFQFSFGNDNKGMTWKSHCEVYEVIPAKRKPFSKTFFITCLPYFVIIFRGCWKKASEEKDVLRAHQRKHMCWVSN